MSEGRHPLPQNPLLGVFGAVGTWPHWERFFDRSRGGLILSFLALLLCLPLLWFVAQQIELEWARRLAIEPVALSLTHFSAIIAAIGMTFTATAAIIATVLQKTERLTLWLMARNWAVFFLCAALSLVFAAVAFTPLPFVVANGALFAAYLGLLPIDIRLAQRAGGFPLMSSILIGCIVVSTTMMVLLTGVLLTLQS